MDDKKQAVRRKDREKPHEEFLKTMLMTTASCSISVVDQEGNPTNHIAFHVYDEVNHEIIVHMSKHGFFGSHIFNNKKVCVAIYKTGKLYTAEIASDFGCEYQSVIVYGNAVIEEDENEQIKLMDLFFNKFFSHIPKTDYQGFSPLTLKPIFILRISIDNWFGKEHRVPEFARSSFALPAMFSDLSD